MRATAEGKLPCQILPDDHDGLTRRRFVEFENAADLRTAVEKLDNREFKGQRVTCVADVRYRAPSHILKYADGEADPG